MSEHSWRPGLITVVVAHDHRFVAPELARSAELEVVADTSFGAVAVALCELVVPDVVVIGEWLADGVVDQFLPSLLRRGTRVMVVADGADQRRLVQLVELGASSVCAMDGSAESVRNAVVDVAAGGCVVPPPVASSIIGEWRLGRVQGGGREVAGGLTEREIEVLGAMVDGLSTKAVGRLLGLATKTVENHKTHIFSKLGVRTQAQAVALIVGGRLPLDSLDQAWTGKSGPDKGSLGRLGR